MRISKRVREEAALILQCCASADQDSDEWRSTHQSMIGLDAVNDARSLAYKAWEYVTDEIGASPAPTYELSHRYRYAEAEALLRCGWSPE